MKYYKLFFFILIPVLLIVPLFHMNTAEITEQENRTLARFPETNKKGKPNYDFGKEFESWLGDRFWGRDQLIDARFQSMYKINGRIENEKAFVGDDGWMFYHHKESIDSYQNRLYFSEIELRKIAAYLQGIHQWSEKHHKQFYFFIVPDKSRIYPEYYSKNYIKFNSDRNSRTIQLINYLKENTSVKIIYNYDMLISNKDMGLLYYKNDTHWNKLGAYLAYKEYMALIGKDFKIELPKIIKISKEKRKDGDLQHMLNNYIKDKTEYLYPEIENKAICNQKDYFANRQPIECHSKKLYKVFFLRASFAIALGEYISNTFGTVYYHWRQKIKSEDLDFIIDNNVDIIILQIVERGLPKLTLNSFPFEK